MIVNRQKFWWTTAWILIVIAALPISCFADSAAKSQLLSGASSFDMGEVDALSTDDASHTFILSNTGNSPVTLSSVRGSCGCEHLAFVVKGKPCQSTVLAADGSVTVQMNVRLRGQPSTKLTKTAWVIGASQNILDTLTLTFTVRQPYSAQPSHLDFGSIPAGTSKSEMATVQIDSPLLPGGEFPSLSCDSPGIFAREVGGIQRTMRDGKSSLSGTYIVTVDDPTQLGPFAGMLSCSLKTPSGGLDNIFIPVSGNVVGTFTAVPRTIAFGAIPASVGAARTLMISGQSLTNLNISSSSPFVTATLSQGTTLSNLSESTVNVTLSPSAPPGAFQSTLTISDGSGNTLTVPVSANVIKSF